MDFELAPYDSDISVTVSDERLYNELGEQGIMSDADGREFFYLAALALECREDDDYPVEAVIMEFIRNSDSVDVSWKEANEIEALLR